MSRRSILGVPTLLVAAGLLAHCSSTEETTQPAPPVVDPSEFLKAPKSCAYLCPNATCAENDTPYACPALGDWAAIPHEEACPAWDGQYPAPVAGQCQATAPSGEAVKRPGPDPQNPGVVVLPDGRAVEPAGSVFTFDDPPLTGGMTSGVVAVPGTGYVLTVDTGSRDHAVRVVDTTLVGSGDPVVSVVGFTGHDWLNSGLAYVAPDRVYVATAFGVVQALGFDAATGALTRDDAASLPLPLDGDGNPWAVSAVAASPDGRLLLVAPVLEKTLLVFDIDPASPSYQQQLGEVALGADNVFAMAFDPHDPSGQLAYASLWGAARVVEIDVSDPTAPTKSRAFVTESDPEGLAFLDARWLAVANDYGESVSLVDRLSGSVTRVAVESGTDVRGLDLSQLAWDEANQRLYALFAGIDALGAWDVDLAQDPPLLAPLGRLPTAWWPSGIAVHPDGSLTVTNLRGKPIGPLLSGSADEDGQMRGSVQQIAMPSLAELSAGENAVATTIAVGERPGYPSIDCPPGVDDFPVPATNDAGPSRLIEHVVFIVRENKTFDALLGDLPTVEGDPNLTLRASTADMDSIWHNFRDVGRNFTIGDNSYNLAVASVQGHQWTTYGRTTDFCERTWGDDFRPVPFCGIIPIGRPDEGSIFDRVQESGDLYALLGEIVGIPAAPPADFNPVDVFYPGGPFQNIGYNDAEKACYFAGRLRVACNLGSFVYMTLPNDHTVGVDPDSPTPETMCAVNDEATGMVVDAISHSPFWASSLIVITEDDPQQGGDHVDYHRTPLVLVSPWVKRGYVSETHIDVASLHKLFAHILGLPYGNLTVKNAGLPLDMFTSSPDYTPYDYAPRSWPLACGQDALPAEVDLTRSWDFAQVDEQPGLGAQVVRWMRGRQLHELPPRLRAEVDARNARKDQGLPPLDDDD